MGCEEVRICLIERGAAADERAEAESHVASCAECAAWLEEQRIVRGGLRDLASQLGGPPPALEEKMRARFRARRPMAAPAPWRWAAAAALAAGLGLGAWFGSSDPPKPAPQPPMAEFATPFLLLDYGRPTQELTSGRLVRVTLPPSAPAWFGLPVDPAAREGIEAEVLLGDDGVAQAVRLVHQRSNQEAWR